MVGDPEVLQAEGAGRLGHLHERGAAVAPVGVAVEGPGQVAELDQGGERPSLGELDLADVLAELGGDVGQPQGGEQVGLGRAGDRPVGADQAVLVERAALRQGPLPHRDVVRLRAGEVVQREGELPLLDAAEVALDAVGQADARLGRAVRQDLGDVRERRRNGRGPGPDPRR